MTKKDFQLIAQTILSLYPADPEAGGTWKEFAAEMRRAVAEKFADALAHTNPLFKRDLFIQAATGVVPVTARKAKAFEPGQKNPGGRDDADYVVDSSEPSSFAQRNRSGRRAGEV